MRIENKQVILDTDHDFEFVALIGHIDKIKYGEMTLKVKNSKPYQIIDIQKSVLLTKDNLKDNGDYGG